MKTGWKLKKTDPVKLERIDHRRIAFSEQIFSFRLPLNSHAQVLSSIQLVDGRVAVLSFAPAQLHIVNSDLDTSYAYELREYFPLQQMGSVRLVLSEMESGDLLICNEKKAQIVLVKMAESMTSLINVTSYLISAAFSL